jgi:hypothetical protein
MFLVSRSVALLLLRVVRSYMDVCGWIWICGSLWLLVRFVIPVYYYVLCHDVYIIGSMLEFDIVLFRDTEYWFVSS